VTEQVLLVDFENVPKLDLAAIPPGVKVPARGLAVRRVEATAEAFALPTLASGLDSHLMRVMQLLSKVDRNKRPRKRQTLLAQVGSFLPKVSALEIEALVARLEREGKISQEQHRLTYHF